MKTPPPPVCPLKHVAICTFNNVPVRTGTTRTCVSTCSRGARTHGDVLNVHTETFRVDTQGFHGATQHTPQHMCALCRHTRGRFERTYGDVFEWTHGFFFSVSHHTTTPHTPHRPHTTPRHKTQHHTETDRDRERRQRQREKRGRKRRRQDKSREKREE